MADSIPHALRDRLAEERAKWLEHHPKPWSAVTELDYHRRSSGAVEHWLDAGHGSCALRRPELAAIIAECLRFFDAVRYFHHAWVVMPNHVHALFSLHPKRTLEKTIHTWKSFTSHRFARFPDAPQPFWQEDYFDRLIRDEDHFANCVGYIRRNPVKAGLRGGFVHFESEHARAIE